MERADYYKKIDELKKLANELEDYVASEEMQYWNMEDTEFNFRTASQYARLESAKATLHIIGTMLAFNTNI